MSILAEIVRTEPINASSTTETASQQQKRALPEGYIGIREAARRHGISPNTAGDAVKEGCIQAETGDWVIGHASTKRAFNLEQQAAFVDYYRTSKKTQDRFHQCGNPDCPCREGQDDTYAQD